MRRSCCYNQQHSSHAKATTFNRKSAAVKGPLICTAGFHVLLFPMMKTFGLMTLLAGFIWLTALPLPADQVVLQNGDSLNGHVLSLTTNTLVLQNVNFGRVTLLRSKVAAITFGTAAESRQKSRDPAHPAAQQTNSVANFSATVRGIRNQSNLVQQVQAQILGASSPAAVNKFNELLDGLSTGKIDLNDLRQQAQTAADQLRSLKKDLGPDAMGELDGYLAILNQFLQETAPTKVKASATNTVSKAKHKASQVGP